MYRRRSIEFIVSGDILMFTRVQTTLSSRIRIDLLAGKRYIIRWQGLVSFHDAFEVVDTICMFAGLIV